MTFTINTHDSWYQQDGASKGWNWCKTLMGQKAKDSTGLPLVSHVV